MKKITFVLITLLYLNSCQIGEADQTVEVDNKYSLVIPSFLNEVDNLNEEASLQYQNLLRSFYIIAIDETKNEIQKALVQGNLLDVYANDIQGYSDLLLAAFEQSVAISEKSEIVDTLVNNMPARLVTIKGRVENIDVFYSLGFIEGKTRYYQILAWTVKGKEDQYKDEMNRIMYSLKEL